MALDADRLPSEPLTEADARAWPLGIGSVRLRDGMAFVSARDPDGFTVDDVDSIPDDGRRYELLDGEVVVTPSPSRPHQRGLLQLGARLLAAERPPAQTLVAPYDVRLSISRRLQPDVLVLPAAGSEIPVLVVEIASPSTRRYDRKEKCQAYAAAGIPSYWLVDLVDTDAPSIEVLALAAEGYQQQALARADEELVVEEPFPLRLRPLDLLA